VGYGDSILIEFPDGKKMLIDTGSEEKSGKLVAYLSSCKLEKIDVVLITHDHPDHLGGLLEVVKKYKIGTILTSGDISKNTNYAPALESAKAKNIRFRVLHRGDKIAEFKSVKIEVLHPDQLRESVNDSSMVIKLKYRNVSFLFAADIGPEICTELVAFYGQKLKSDVLKVPWHGKTKSAAFINMVAPKLAIISVGPYKWPAPLKEVLEDYKKLNIPVLRTDELGTIVVQTDGRGFSFSTQK
jgi:competence protein ComEC